MIAGLAGHFDDELLEMVAERRLGDLVLRHIARNAFEKAEKTPERRVGKDWEVRNELLDVVEGRMHRAARHDKLFQAILQVLEANGARVRTK